LFKKHCAVCHKHGTEGENIGPELTGMAVHPKEELLAQILDPSRSVEGNFRIYTLITMSGRILNGMLANETRTSVELVDAEAKRYVIQREDIDELISSRKSLMPEGFENQMTDGELADLLEFLAHKGKYLPIPLDKFATIISTEGMFTRKESTVERLVFPDWTPKTFNGVPFVLVDPREGRTPNVIMLFSPNGSIPTTMPRTVILPCNSPAKSIHMLSGVSGWGAKAPAQRGVSMIVRLHYADGTREEHPLIDGQHFADYIGVFDVPKSQLAFKLRGQQIRYLTIEPQRSGVIREIELAKGNDRTAPIVMAVTVEVGDN
jgi:putative heme-binding domain-containing protein